MARKKQSKFTQVPNDLLKVKLTTEEKLTWIVLKSFDWNGNGCYPSLATVTEMVGCSRRQMQRIISSLIDKGFCTRTTCFGKPSSLHVKLPLTLDTQSIDRESIDTQSDTLDRESTHPRHTVYRIRLNNKTKEKDSVRTTKPTTPKNHPDTKIVSDHMWETYQQKYDIKPKVNGKVFFTKLDEAVREDGKDRIMSAWDEWMKDTSAFATEAAHTPGTFIAANVLTKYLGRCHKKSSLDDIEMPVWARGD